MRRFEARPPARFCAKGGGNSEAIQLPRDVAFGKDLELIVVRSRDVLTVYPAATSIPEMIARLKAMPSAAVHRTARRRRAYRARNGFRRGKVRAVGFC